MHRQEGFTLIELMIVILIIGILVGIAVPVFLAAQASAQRRTCEANRRTVISSADIYAADSGTGQYPTNIDPDLYPTYLNKNFDAIDACPAGGAITWNWSLNAPPDPTCDVHI